MRAVVIAAVLLCLAGCDWIPYAFMNSIPFKGHDRDVYVYLGIDGLSYHTTRAAMDRGAFSGSDWHLAKFITMFPGTSDASWTRIMHTEKLGGYEIEYYDPNQDKVINRGLLGLAKHIMPSFADFANFEFDYLRAFDFRANGYADGLNAYRDTFTSLGDKLDNLFYLLDGRIRTSSVFSAYLLEYDVLGHMQTAQDVERGFHMLAERIQKFRDDHPRQNIHFTILSDHGMDFIRVHKDRFVSFDQELGKVGIQVVDSLRDHDPKQGLFAIPIMHTRVTYLALHTHPDHLEEISGRITRLPSVDLAVHRLTGLPAGERERIARDERARAELDSVGEWYAVWSEGKLALYFGFDPRTNRYLLPTEQSYARFGVKPELFAARELQAGSGYWLARDEELFHSIRHASYPDLFYRVRTSLSSVSTQYPADVMVSFRPTYASLGFTLPGSDDIASSGFHGAMEELGTLGTLLTNERDLPDAVRADNFLDLFPRMRDHLHALGVKTIDGDPGAALQYR